MSIPSPELKDLYRRVVRRIHPDLAISEKDRARCERLMKEANRAYEAGDEAALRAVLDPDVPPVNLNSAPPPTTRDEAGPWPGPLQNGTLQRRSGYIKAWLITGLVSVLVLWAFAKDWTRSAMPLMNRLGVYEGVAHNATYGQEAPIRVTIMKQKGTGIYGCLFVRPPLYGTGPFVGQISKDKLSFTVTSVNSGLKLNFEGSGADPVTGNYKTNRRENGTFYLFRLPSPRPDRDCR